MQALTQIKSQKLEGIVEMDETYVLYSEKGKCKLPRKSRKRGIYDEQVCVIVARDRTKHTVAEVATFGRMSAAILDELLTSRLQSGVIFCTDEEPTFRKYCREQKLQHEKVHPGKKRYVTKEIYHIQNVNAYHQRFMDETTALVALSRVQELFRQALMQPMKTTGKDLSSYCETQTQKLVS